MNVYFQAFKIIKSSRSFLNQGAELKALMGEEDFNKTVDGYIPQQTNFAARLIRTQDFLLQWKFREYFVKKYAWAITDPIAINFISKYCTTNKLKLIEVGSGSGYWASLLSQKKVDCLCFDSERRDTTFFPVNHGNPDCIKNNKDRSLFLCWPPYAEDMAYDCLKNYDGNFVFYIGEEQGGCCGNDGFFELLEENFKLEKIHTIPQWDGVHDSLYVYQRKKERSHYTKK